jgi:hypothetical protein
MESRFSKKSNSPSCTVKRSLVRSISLEIFLISIVFLAIKKGTINAPIENNVKENDLKRINDLF